MTFGQLSKYTSYMYKNLTPEEKAHWEERADEDKARYEAEMAAYIAMHPDPTMLDPISSPSTPVNGATAAVPVAAPYSMPLPVPAASSKKRKKGFAKDLGAPKRARGSFVFFTCEMRPQIMKEFPGIKFAQIGSILGERWRALPPEHKKRYEDMAAQDKMRFDAEMQKYSGMIQRTRKGPAPRKRSRVSFVFFTCEMRPQIKKEFPGITFAEIGAILGERWRALAPEEKKRYEDMAAEDKIRFEMEMQEYSYQISQQQAQEQNQEEHHQLHHHHQEVVGDDVDNVGVIDDHHHSHALHAVDHTADHLEVADAISAHTYDHLHDPQAFDTSPYQHQYDQYGV